LPRAIETRWHWLQRTELRTIAFRAILTGAFGYPPELAAPVVSQEIETALAGGMQFEEIRLVFYDADDLKVFLRSHNFTSR
jgi:O-acetyl-ADP-ribose deacetylase (regulator of RNase III)